MEKERVSKGREKKERTKLATKLGSIGSPAALKPREINRQNQKESAPATIKFSLAKISVFFLFFFETDLAIWSQTWAPTSINDLIRKTKLARSSIETRASHYLYDIV